VRSVELFAGAGGLAIGMANAGFHHAAVVEWDHHACETFRENQRHHALAVEGWPVHEGDARGFDFASFGSDISVVSGGPPCQPFSMGGKHQGQRDDRNMFPEAVRAVRELMPRAFIFENVRGLLRKNFAAYFSHIQLQLQYPEIVRRKGEKWMQHRARLERHHTANRGPATYNVLVNVLNAADYGVPQRRERVFIVGFRSDLRVEWSCPAPTHSEDALLASQWVNADYWDEHNITTKNRKAMAEKFSKRVEAIKARPALISLKRWQTTRDAIQNLPDPESEAAEKIANHVFTPGARTYTGHTGSSLDEPSKTLKAGYHGVPGGENMFVRDDKTVRYFTVREAARLQTFPDEYEFHGSWTQTMRQLGNAVPVKLGEVIARSVAASLRACEPVRQRRNAGEVSDG